MQGAADGRLVDGLLAQGDERLGSRVERLRALTRAMVVRQIAQEPVHTWEPAQLAEAGGWRENFLRIGQFMTTDLVTAHEDELIDLVASLMNWRRIGQVPVEDDDHNLVGLVAVNDLLDLVANGLPEGSGATVPVREIMRRDPITVTPETSTLEAMQIMSRERMRSIRWPRTASSSASSPSPTLWTSAGRCSKSGYKADGASARRSRWCDGVTCSAFEQASALHWRGEGPCATAGWSARRRPEVPGLT